MRINPEYIAKAKPKAKPKQRERVRAKPKQRVRQRVRAQPVRAQPVASVGTVTRAVERATKGRRRDTIKRLFDRLDKDADGYLTKKELRPIRKNKKASTLLKRFDTNGDGKMSYREFVKLMNAI